MFLSAIRQAYREVKRVDPNNVSCGKGTDGKFTVNHLTSEAGKLAVQLANPENRLQRRFKFAKISVCLDANDRRDLDSARLKIH